MKVVKKKEQVPVGRQYVILEFSERIALAQEQYLGKLNIAPAHIEYDTHYLVFETEEEWRNDIIRRTKQEYGYKNFVAMVCIPALLTTELVVTVPA